MRKSLRDRVWSRARGRCEYCQMPQECDPIPFEIDHVIAEKHHGRTELENLALACFACNNHKGANLSGRDGLTGPELGGAATDRNTILKPFTKATGCKTHVPNI